MATSLSAVRFFGALALLAVTGGAVLAKPPEPGFWLVGNPLGSTSSTVTGLTSSGRVTSGGGKTSYSWTEAGGRNDFGLLPGMPKINYAMGLSDNGILAGSMWIDGQYDKARAYRWTGTGPLQDLGLLPGETRSFAWGVSGDGGVVVGHAEHGSMSPLGQAFRWTPAKGMEGIGHLKPFGSISKATGVSRDGKTIVGVSRSQSLDFEAFVWREGAGMTGLPTLPGSPTVETFAEAVNADGTVVVGGSTSATGYGQPVRWVNGKIEDLTIGSAFGGGVAYAVSDDGNVIGGFAGQAFVWSPSTGMLTAVDYLARHEVTAPSGYLLEEMYAVSGDGLTFGGQAKNLTTGVREGFVATVPASDCKVDCDASGELDIDDFICFQTRFAIADPYADCDASGSLDIDDFICFQTLFAVGCQG